MSSPSAGDSVRAGAAVDGDGSDWHPGRRRSEICEVRAERVIRLPRDVAFEAAEDLTPVQTLGGALGGVGAGALAMAQAADGDHVQRPVRLAVAAEVESVPGRAAGA